MRPSPARQATLREHNLGLVLSEVIDAAAAGSPPPSRADVAAATGLARATVSALVDRLVGAGLVAELAPTLTLRAGRPAVPLRPAARTLAAVGAEVNVDYLGVRVLDLTGAVLAERVEPGDFRDSEASPVLARLGALVDEVVATLAGEPPVDRLTRRSGDGTSGVTRAGGDETSRVTRAGGDGTSRVTRAGGGETPGATRPGESRDDGPPVTRLAGTALALPGIVDRGAGPLRVAPNLGWRDVDVVTALVGASRTFAAHPPLLANEADLAARAESAARLRRIPAGAGAAAPEAGTGPGPGIGTGPGATPGFAAAPAPPPADGPDGERARPSFVYVSGEIGIGGALVLDGEIFAGRHGWAGELGQTLVDGLRLERLVGQDALLRAAGLDPRAGVDSLVRAARAGDERVRDVLHEAGALLGRAVANLVNLVDVNDVVLGGTYARLAEWIAEPARASLARHVLAAPWAPPTVDVARAGEIPAMTGAALSVLAEVVADPSSWLLDPVDA
jgi:predicted NBD/HSP70 family sugar kinase